MGRNGRNFGVIGTCVGSLLVSACGPGGTPSAARAVATPPPGCGELDKIDRSRLPGGWDGAPPGPHGEDILIGPDLMVSGAQHEHARLQEGSTATPSKTAEAEIRLAQQTGGYVPPQHFYSLVARREDGAWTLYATTETRAPEKPNPTLEAPWVERIEPRRTIRLTAEAGAKLDALLADRCLWSAPRFIPQFIPMKGGGVYGCPSHGPDTTFDIRAGDRRWSGGQFCRTVGPQMDIEQLLFLVATGDAHDSLNPKLFRTGPSEERTYDTVVK